MQVEYVWVVLALTSGFALATSDAFTKRALAAHNEYLIAWLRLVFSLPLLGVSLFFIPLPPVDRDFFTAFFTALPLEIVAIILYVKALKVSPLSLTLPFLALTPVFLIVIPYLILGESLSSLGTIGVLLIATGSYTLNVKEFRKGIFEPFAAVKREKGSLFMIVVALIYAFTSTLGKRAIEHSSPLFFGAAYFAAVTLFLSPLALCKGRGGVTTVFRSGALRASILPGIFYALMVLSHMMALSLTEVAYMISVKRLSLLIGVVYGYLFFKEPALRERLLGASLMLSGFVLIVIYH